MLNQAAPLVYFKRKTNACYAINVQAKLSFPNLLALLAREESITSNSLLLVHRGKQVESSQSLAQLGNKSIVHLVNLQEVKRERICVTLRDIRNNVSTKISNGEARIRDFIRQHLATIDGVPYFRIGLFYLGKVLQPQKTFAEELVENNSEMFVIDLADHPKPGKQKAQAENTENQPEVQPLKVKQTSNKTAKASPQITQAEGLRSPPIRIELQAEPQKQESKVVQKEYSENELGSILAYDFQETPSKELTSGQVVFKQRQKMQISRVHEHLQAAEQDLKVQAAEQDLKEQAEQGNKFNQQPPNEGLNAVKRAEVLKQETIKPKEGDRTLQQPNQISQLPQVTYYNFKIKISQVQSHESEEQQGNKVSFNQKEQDSISCWQCPPIQSNPKAPNQAQPREKLGERDILPGDLIFTGADYQSQTISFIDNLLQEYKGMFQ